jgi:hypothetical protein
MNAARNRCDLALRFQYRASKDAPQLNSQTAEASAIKVLNVMGWIYQGIQGMNITKTRCVWIARLETNIAARRRRASGPKTEPPSFSM